MSDIFQSFDSNGAVAGTSIGASGDDSQDNIRMASPSQSSPMGGNSNSNSALAATAPVPAGSAGNTSSTSGAGAGGGGAAAGSSSATKLGLSGLDNQPVLTKPRLLELVREVDTTAQLDEDVEEILLQMADDFIEDCVKSTCNYAKHRKVNKVEVRDAQLHLERKYNMWMPGFGTDELRPYKRAALTEAHKQRLALIRKTIKKY